MDPLSKHHPGALPPIYIVSGGNGASGRQLIDTVLVQYPELKIPVLMMTNIRHDRQIENIVAQAGAEKALIVHTMVDSRLRALLIQPLKLLLQLLIRLIIPLPQVSRLIQASPSLIHL